tara:strand:+ start:182 stop:544 length:363 start_codon:yes stop_codon:yes gene_type:complete
MKIKTRDLQGAALDWAVALIECPEWKEEGYLEVFPHDLNFDDGTSFAPSTDWAQGGPIIEREKIQLDVEAVGVWGAFIEGCTKDFLYHGPTPLAAAMRCYVASKLGPEMDVPVEFRESAE